MDSRNALWTSCFAETADQPCLCAEGMILYNGQKRTTGADFISLGLVGGRLEFRSVQDALLSNGTKILQLIFSLVLSGSMWVQEWPPSGTPTRSNWGSSTRWSCTATTPWVTSSWTEGSPLTAARRYGAPRGLPLSRLPRQHTRLYSGQVPGAGSERGAACGRLPQLHSAR